MSLTLTIFDWNYFENIKKPAGAVDSSCFNSYTCVSTTLFAEKLGLDELASENVTSDFVRWKTFIRYKRNRFGKSKGLDAVMVPKLATIPCI